MFVSYVCVYCGGSFTYEPKPRVVGAARTKTTCPTCRKTRTYELNIKRKFDMSLGDYEARLKEQGGVCAACGGVDQRGWRLSQDHSHTTGALRGLLCNNCNTSLGLLGDSVTRLQQLITYLEDHR